MAKRLSTTKEREKCVSLKFEEQRTQIEGECQKKLRKRQEELGSRIHSGYGQGELRRIQIQKVRELVKALVAIDIEVYGEPANEKAVNSIVERIKEHVDAHIEGLINELALNQSIPANSEQGYKRQFREEGVGIIGNIRRDLLLLVYERKRENTLNYFQVICWVVAFLLFIVLLLDILKIVSMTPERLALVGGIVALVIIPFAKKLRILGVEFERLSKDASDKMERQN